MDLVKIGFLIQTSGLEKANKEVDSLLDKTGKIGTVSKKSATEVEASQKKAKKATEGSTKAADNNTKAVEKTTKALEKQKIIGDYLGKGLDKTTATTVANFKQLGASVSETSTMLDTLANNKGILQARKDLEILAKQQKKAAADVIRQEQELEKARQKRFSSEQNYYLKVQDEAKKSEAKRQNDLNKAIAAEESARQKRLLAEQNYYLKVQEEAKKAQAKEQAALDQAAIKEEKLRQQRLSKVQAQYLSDMESLKKFEQEQEKARQRKFSAEQKQYQKDMDALKKSQDAQEALRAKTLSAYQSKYIADMERIKKLKDAEIAKEKQANAEREKALRIEQARTKYVEQGFGKGDAKRLATLEVAGADPDYLDRYKKSLATTTTALGSFGVATTKASNSHSGLMSQIKGIAFYAVLSTAIYGVITALTDLAVSIVNTADEMANLTQRLSIYLPANIKVNQVLERMGEIAKENRVTLADTGKLFTQLLPPIQRIKGGVAETTTIVDAFGKAMLIGGANTMEAASATIQFGQAMASGKLAGDEFRSLAEASPRLLQAIADGAGIAAQKLKEMSSAGKLTSGLVSAALLDQFIQLEYEATKMGQTVSGAFNEGMVAYQLFINTFNEQTGFTKSIVEGIRSVVKSLEGFGKGFLASLKDGDSTLNSFLGLLRTVWDLVGAVVGGFTDVVGWILKAGEKTGLWKAIFDSTKLTIITIVDTLAKIPFVIVNIGTRIAELVLKPFEKFIELAQKGLDLAGFVSAAARLGQGLSNYRGFMGDIKGVTGEVVTGFNLLSLGVKETENSTGKVKDILDKLKQQNKDLVIQEKEKKAMTDSQYISEYAKLLLQQEGVVVNAENLNLVKKELEERFKITQEQSKQMKLAGEAQAKKDEAEAKAKKAIEEAKKAAEQEQKRLQGIRDSYQEQIAYVRRLQMLLSQGEKTDVARIAAEKDYVDAIGETSVARQVAEAKRQLSITEYNMSLDEEADILKEIQKLQDRGATNEQARALAQAKYVADELGMLALEYKLVNELENKKLLLTDQARTQGDINRLLAQGLSIEEAETEAAFARLGFIANGLSLERKIFKDKILFQQKLLAERQADGKALETMNQLSKESALYVEAQAKSYSEIGKSIAIAAKLAQNPNMKPSRAKELVEAESLNAYEKELATLKYQTYINTLNESDAVKQLVEKYADADSVQIGALANQQRLLEIAKELSAEAEKQRKNPLGDFSNVDFSVFGDFGNPFQSALDGLNELIRTTMSGGEQIKKLNEEIDAAKSLGLDTTKQELDLNLELQKQAKDKKQATDNAITSSLSLTKSLFKEESKGYKVVSKLEKAYQASKIAFALWQKKDTIAMLALSLKAHITDMLGFTTGAAAKVAAQGAVNVAKGTEAVLTQGSGDPYTAFARMAAMAALVAGLGIAISGVGGSSGSVIPTNEGTGTVFGDTTAQSESIKKSIDLLAENSDVTLPLTAAMLKSLQNIENNIGGLANLLIRNAGGSKLLEGVNVGFTQNSIGKSITKGFDAFNKMTFGLADTLTLGLFSSIGKLIGGLFGKKVSIQGQGLYGGSQKLSSVVGNGFNLYEYVDIRTKKKTLGITTSDKTSTRYNKASQELSNQFTLIFKGFNDAILAAAPMLDRSTNEVAAKLNDFVISIGRVNLQGLNGEQIQEKLNAVFGAEADRMAQAALGGLEDFQKVGEGYFETLMRVSNSIEMASVYTDRLNVSAIKYTNILNKQGDVTTEIIRQSVLLNEGNKNIKNGFYDLVNTFNGTAGEITDFVITLRELQDAVVATGKNGDYLTSAMFAGAGSLDRLQDGLDSYFEMLSPSEQAAELVRRLTREFAEFGEELPSDVKAFRALVSSIDITTEAGQKLYGKIIALAPEFTDLQDALEKTNSEVNQLVKSLRDLAEQARQARGETEQPRNLDYARAMFESTAMLAMQGDTEAANKLMSLGTNLMNLSKQYSVDGSEYARDLAWIQRAATVSADVQEAGLGYTSSTLSTALSSGNTTPTLATTSSSTDAEIKGLREDLNAALLAIAKYTQSTASKLENWDDGNRMMVGVIQEAGDPKVPVTTA